MIAAHGSPLVAGSSRKPDEGKPMLVKAVRGFMHAGRSIAVGTVVELPAMIAAEVIATGKAMRQRPAEGDEAPPLAATDIEAGAARRRGRPTKTKEHGT